MSNDYLFCKRFIHLTAYKGMQCELVMKTSETRGVTEKSRQYPMQKSMTKLITRHLPYTFTLGVSIQSPFCSISSFWSSKHARRVSPIPTGLAIEARPYASFFSSFTFFFIPGTLWNPVSSLMCSATDSFANGLLLARRIFRFFVSRNALISCCKLHVDRHISNRNR